MTCTNIASLPYVVVPLPLWCGPYDRPVLGSIHRTVEAARSPLVTAATLAIGGVEDGPGRHPASSVAACTRRPPQAAGPPACCAGWHYRSQASESHPDQVIPEGCRCRRCEP